MTIETAYIVDASTWDVPPPEYREIVGVKLVTFEPGHDVCLCFVVKHRTGMLGYMPVGNMRGYEVRGGDEPKGTAQP